MKMGDGVLYQGMLCTVTWIDPLPTGDLAIEDETGVVHEVKEFNIQLTDRYKVKATEMFGVNYRDVTQAQRRSAESFINISERMSP